jgi:PKHD-type hydroxylase
MEWVFRRVTDVTQALNNNFFNFDLFGFLEGFQFTKYEAPSDFYGLHMDKSFGKGIRKLSLTIQLSEPESYEGGELSFYKSQYFT